MLQVIVKDAKCRNFSAVGVEVTINKKNGFNAAIYICGDYFSIKCQFLILCEHLRIMILGITCRLVVTHGEL
jgi:hypothetical protein